MLNILNSTDPGDEDGDNTIDSGLCVETKWFRILLNNYVERVSVFPADSSATHHLSSGNVQQIGLVVAGRQGLRLQSAGILQLLYGGELRLAVAGLSHTEA